MLQCWWCCVVFCGVERGSGEDGNIVHSASTGESLCRHCCKITVTGASFSPITRKSEVSEQIQSYHIVRLLNFVLERVKRLREWVQVWAWDTTGMGGERETRHLPCFSLAHGRFGRGQRGGERMPSR